MMEFTSVEVVDSIANGDDKYSLAIFASGFEARSTHVPKLFDSSRFHEIAILGFPQENFPSQMRRDNDEFFRANICSSIVDMDSVSDDEFIYSLLDKALSRFCGPVFRVCVDYSVMTRGWYASILNWARVTESLVEIELDFLYASGKYLDEFQPLQIQEIVSLPNFEGVSTGFRNTTAIFCVGYDTYGTLAVYDRIEPDVTYCCVAGTEDSDPAVLKAIRNNELLLESADSVISLPLLDLVSAFRALCNLVLTVERDSHIVVVPMGPKPHVLVTMLVALRMPWITCLYARGIRQNAVRVEPAGPVSSCRVRFSPAGESAQAGALHR